MSNTVHSAGAEHALREVLASWNRSAATWDVKGLAALYAEDALMFGGRPGLSVGVPGMQAYFGSYVGTLAGAELELVEQHLLELAPEVYLAQGFGVFQFRRVDGRTTGTTMRTTLVIARPDGQWKIRQHHFSTIPDKPPIDG
jgi:uncharacterized protein (TIGR02246 family)